MSTLVEVAELERPVGLPDWIDRSLNVKAGRDPLGLQTITLDRIMPVLLPGILVLSRRARYFTFFPFLLQEFERLRLPASNDVLSDFVKHREFELAAAVQLCPRGCGAISAGAVGKDRAKPAIRDLQGAHVNRQGSVQTYLGGYGLYYRSPLIDLGLVIPKGTQYGEGENALPVDVVARADQAQAMGDAYRDAISDTRYYREWMLGTSPIPVDVLLEYSERACLCRLPEFPEEQSLIRCALFEPVVPDSPEPVMAAINQRRRSFAVFLHELDRAPDAAELDGAFRGAVWQEFMETQLVDGPLRQTLAQWSALVAKEYLQEGLSSIFAHFCRLGLSTAGLDGLSPPELDRLLREDLLGTGPTAIGNEILEYESGSPSPVFVDRVATGNGALVAGRPLPVGCRERRCDRGARPHR